MSERRPYIAPLPSRRTDKTVTPTQRFCPTCGAPTSADPLGEHGLCRSCYLEEHALLRTPDRLTIRRCGNCGSIERDGEWVDNDDDRVEIALTAVTESIEVLEGIDDLTWEARTESIDDDTLLVTGIFDIEFDGGWERRERTNEVAFERTICRRCSRIAGDDYGAIVQLRATDRTPAAAEISRAREIAAGVLDTRVDAGDRNSFLTDVIEREEGLDLRLSTPRLGDQLATALKRDLGGTLDSSRTLVTTDSDGREVYRVTFTLRLGPYCRGDILSTDDGALLVERGTQGLRVLDLHSGERRTIEADDLEANRVASREEASEATVVARLDDRAVQVLHPDTHEAVTVSYYEGIDPEGETVEAIDIDGQLYLLPDDDG